MKKLFENDTKTAIVFVDTTIGYIVLRLSGRVNFEDYKEVMLLLIQQAKEYKITQVILNNYHLEYDTPKSRIWFLTSFVYQVQRTLGEQLSVAIIRPRNNFQRVALNTLVSLIQSQGFEFTIRFFVDEPQAIEWFQESNRDN
ncbi:hypothetical protein BKI52_06400 [marine bacterium AO1-C]|nr:hypothetical protein BKI52_06400 [marine bacterium AO1-C]